MEFPFEILFPADIGIDRVDFEATAQGVPDHEHLGSGGIVSYVIRFHRTATRHRPRFANGYRDKTNGQQDLAHHLGFSFSLPPPWKGTDFIWEHTTTITTELTTFSHISLISFQQKIHPKIKRRILKNHVFKRHR
jgi:hypothetical protein